MYHTGQMYRIKIINRGISPHNTLLHNHWFEGFRPCCAVYRKYCGCTFFSDLVTRIVKHKVKNGRWDAAALLWVVRYPFVGIFVATCQYWFETE